LFLVSLIEYSLTATYSTKEGDVWLRKSYETLFQDSYKECKDLDGHLIEIYDILDKNEVIEFISPPTTTSSVFNIWLGAVKKENRTYGWMTKKTQVDHDLLPFDESMPVCESKCCNLVMQPSGSVFATPCKETTPRARSICHLLPVTSVKDRIESVNRDMRYKSIDIDNNRDSISKLESMMVPFQTETKEKLEAIKLELEKEKTLRENLQDQLQGLSSSSKTFSEDIESMKTNRTTLYVLCVICMIGLIGLAAMTHLIIKRQRKGFTSW